MPVSVICKKHDCMFNSMLRSPDAELAYCKASVICIEEANAKCDSYYPAPKVLKEHLIKIKSVEGR